MVSAYCNIILVLVHKLTRHLSSGIYVDPFKLSKNNVRFRTVTKVSLREFGKAFANCKCNVIILADGSIGYRHIGNERIQIVASLGAYGNKPARDSSGFGWNMLETLRESITTREYLNAGNFRHTVFHRTEEKTVWTYWIRLDVRPHTGVDSPPHIVPLPKGNKSGTNMSMQGTPSIHSVELDIVSGSEGHDEEAGDESSDSSVCGCDSDDGDDCYDYEDLLPIDMDDDDHDTDDDDDDDDDLVLIESAANEDDMVFSDMDEDSVTDGWSTVPSRESTPV